MSRILIVDDVPAMCEQYAYDLERLGGHETVAAGGGAEALRILEREPVDCVILDLEMPGIDGFDVLTEMSARGLTIPVIVYTGTGNYDRCVRAVKLGAYSFIDKGEPTERVAREIENALEAGRLTREVAQLKRKLADDLSLVGSSPPMTEMKAAIVRLARIPSPVLILGESGSGKELVARELHQQSERARRPYVTVNSAALPENLVENELFGHERGAFTGADRMRTGAFEAANGGTLFLDEIGELPLPAQSKLLRVLEEQTVTRLGGSKPIRIDTRVVAATNRDLDEEVTAGRFREDLLFRFNVHVVRVPPLREHLSDIPELIDHFLGQICARFGVRRKRISAGALAHLEGHDWRRNNVRELRNAVEQMVFACEGNEITEAHVPATISSGGRRPAGTGQAAGTLRDLKSAAEREIILAALERNDWHITRTAAELGLADHASLLKVMRRHKLKRK